MDKYLETNQVFEFPEWPMPTDSSTDVIALKNEAKSRATLLGASFTPWFTATSSSNKLAAVGYYDALG